LTTSETQAERFSEIVVGRRKNGSAKPRIVPMNPEVSAFLKSKIDPNINYIVGNTDYTTYDEFKDKYEAFFKRLNESLVNAGKKPIAMKPPHTCRHTVSTLWQAYGYAS